MDAHGCGTIPSDASGATYALHESGCPVKRTAKQTREKQRPKHIMVQRMLTEPQITGQSTMTGTLWNDATGSHRCEHVLHRNIGVSMNIGRCFVLAERPAVLYRAKLLKYDFVLSLRIMLKPVKTPVVKTFIRRGSVD